jgi:hypothetical protein
MKTSLFLSLCALVLLLVAPAHACSPSPDYRPIRTEASGPLVVYDPLGGFAYTNLDEYMLIHRANPDGTSCETLTYIEKFFLVQVAIITSILLCTVLVFFWLNKIRRTLKKH